MSRSRLASRLLLAGVALVLASCGETTDDGVSQLNLDRPVDVAFACSGGLRLTGGQPATVDQQVTISAQPVEACTIRSAERGPSDPTPLPPGQESLVDLGGTPVPIVNWYGFILQSAPGTVTIATFQTKPSSMFGGGDVSILDADPLTPGMNGISVGEDPIAITTDKVGCYEMVANAGSCDLSALEINSALDVDDPAVRVSRIAVKNAGGAEVLARPAAMVAEPAGGVIGEACPAQPTGLVYLAYPACHLVAAVDSSTGTIVGGIDYASGTPTITDGNVSCPAECRGGGTFTAGIRPVALDLEKDARNGVTRLVVGAENSGSLTLAEIGADGLPMSVRQIALEDTIGTAGDFGVTSVAIGPQIGMGGSGGMLNDDLASGGQFQFVYAVATDASVRVVDVFTLDKECDTQIDPRLIENETNVRKLSCFPVGDPANPARRADARGPGIRLPGAYHDVVPTSVDIFQAPDRGTRTTGPETLVGYFAMVSASNGSTYVIDVDDDDRKDFEESAAPPLDVQLPLAIAHHLRDAVPNRDLLPFGEFDIEGEGDDITKPICDTNGPDPDSSAGNSGGVRSTANPTRNVPSGFVSAEKATELPSLRQVLCEGYDLNRPVSELAFAAPDDVRDLTYQDLMKLRDEIWTLTYEGPLSADTADTDVDGPPIRVSELHIDENGMHLVDDSRPFCAAGVEPFDIVQLRGCDASLGDAQCPLGYTCFVHPSSQVTGLGACMLEDEADRLANACKDFLTSSRRYTVGRSESGELRLLPRRRVLQETPLDGCSDDAQCTMLADYAKQLGSSSHPVDDTTEPSTRTYRCEADPDRPPLDGPGQTGKRCIETCSDSSDCSTGGICRNGQCFEGVIPPQSCVNAPQRYELRAHDAFTVIGTRSGYVHGTIQDGTTNKCIRDPDAHPFDIGRIPLAAPACDPTADPRTGRRPDGTFEPNPCSTTVDQVETAPNYVAGSCTLDDPTTKIVTRTAPAIKFRNRGFMIHLVDPTYPGDAQCIRDAQGGLVGVPMVFPNYQLTWRQTAGLTPLTLPDMKPAYPVKVLRGPTQSIWVVDEGDYLSTSLSEASTRGKVYRVEPGSFLVNTLQ